MHTAISDSSEAHDGGGPDAGIIMATVFSRTMGF